MATLTSLPAELVAHIGALTDPHSHLDLICTCSYIAGALRDIVARHRAAAAHTSFSDLEPQTIPQLLRRVLRDPIAAHHVRSIQIWGARTCWADWRPIQLETIEGSNDHFQPVQALDWTYAPDEIEEYLDLTTQFLPLLYDGGVLREQARDQLASGDDGLMKALLIVLCPRLDSLYYAQGLNCQEEDPEEIVPTSLYYLTEMVMFHRVEPVECWPPCLQSLRHVAIGVETGTWLDESGGTDRCEPEFLATLLILPNLESLYLRGLSQGDADGSETYDVSPGCSTLRHLFLDDISQVDTETWKHMMLACSAQLTSLALRGGAQDNVNDFVELAIENCINLQSVMFYGDEGSDLQGCRSGLLLPHVLGGYHSAADLRHVTLVAGDLALGSLLHGDKNAYPEPRERFINYMVPSGADPLLPSTLEVLALAQDFRLLPHFLAGSNSHLHPVNDVADWFDDVLVALISARVGDDGLEEDSGEDVQDEHESHPAQQVSSVLEGSKDHESGPHQQVSQKHESSEDEGDESEPVSMLEAPYMYPNLKIIYIDPWDPRLPHETPAISGPNLWLQKSIRAAHERGIEVRTKVNINPRHQDIDMHLPPDRYDMRPDLTPPENETFDPFIGQWVERGCENCGVCASCYRLFPQEAWQRAYKAPSDDENDDAHDTQDQITQEIWTRGFYQIGQDDCVETYYYVQPLEAFRRDRHCEGEDVYGRLEGVALPSLGFPVTRRKLLAQQSG